MLYQGFLSQILVIQSSSERKEAAIRGAQWRKVLLEISQNSQENTCARVSFLIKLQAQETLAQMFSCEFCKISENVFFTVHLQITASGRKGTIFIPLPLAPAYKHSDICNFAIEIIPYTFNWIVCIYQTAARWELPTVEISIWLIA